MRRYADKVGKGGEELLVAYLLVTKGSTARVVIVLLVVLGFTNFHLMIDSNGCCNSLTLLL